MERFLLAAISLLLQKSPDCVDTHGKIQCFNNLQTGDIGLFADEGCDVLTIDLREFGLLSTKARLCFIASSFVSPFQQTID